MASPLESQIAKAIYAGFRGKLLKGVLRRSLNAVSGGLDALGDAAATGPQDYAIEGFREAYSAYTRANAGIPETDAKIIVLARSVPARPQQGDAIWLYKDSEPGWWQVRARPDVDPATATYTMRCFLVPGVAP